MPTKLKIKQIYPEPAATSNSVLTGTPTAPTPSTNDDSTKIATTAYVKACIPTSVGDANTPVYVNASGVVTTTGKSFANYSLTTHTHDKITPVSGSALPTSNLSIDGLQLVEVYNNGYPENYGNVINVQGTSNKGAGQLFLAWSGSTNGISNVYYRNKRDNQTTWSDWKKFAFTDSDITGKAANVTGTVAIANGGTGAVSRTAAVKALFNESVEGNATHLLGITSDWSKCGYVYKDSLKSILGLSTWNAVTVTAVTTYCPSAGGNYMSVYQNPVLKLCCVGFNISLAATTIPGSTAIINGFPKALHDFGCVCMDSSGVGIRMYISTTGSLMLDGSKTLSTATWVNGSVTYPYSSL